MKHHLPILILSIGLLSACNETVAPVQKAPLDKGATSSTAPANAANKKINDLVPLDRPILVEAVHLSDHPGAGGFVDVDLPEMKVGSHVYMSMIFRQTPPGSAANVVWKDGKGKQLGEEHRPLQTGAKNVTFEAAGATKWKAGKYLAEAWMGAEKIGEKPFTLVKTKK